VKAAGQSGHADRIGAGGGSSKVGGADLKEKEEAFPGAFPIRFIIHHACII